MKKKLNKKGFTLTELMVVVVILGLLAAVALPIFGNVEHNSAVTTCDANIRTLESALSMYAADNSISDMSVLTFGTIEVGADGRLVNTYHGGATEGSGTPLKDYVKLFEANCPVDGADSEGAYSIIAGVVECKNKAAHTK